MSPTRLVAELDVAESTCRRIDRILSDGTTTKPQAQPMSQYNMFCTPCRASYGVSASMRLPDRGLFRKYSKGPFVIGGTNMKRTTLTAHEASDGHSVAVEHEKPNSAPWNFYRRTVDSEDESSIRLINYSGMHTPLQTTIGHSPIMCGWQPWMKGRGCF